MIEIKKRSNFGAFFYQRCLWKIYTFKYLRDKMKFLKDKIIKRELELCVNLSFESY